MDARHKAAIPLFHRNHVIAEIRPHAEKGFSYPHSSWYIVIITWRFCYRVCTPPIAGAPLHVGNRLQWLISLRMPIAPKRVELAIRSLKVPHAIVLVRLFRLTIVDPFPRGGLSPHARTAMWKLPPKSCLQSPLHDQMP